MRTSFPRREFAAKLARSFVGLPVTIYGVEPVRLPVMIMGPTSVPQVALPPIARIITFNGTFKSTDVNLPQ